MCGRLSGMGNYTGRCGQFCSIAVCMRGEREIVDGALNFYTRL